jgi:hypothetical protein
MAMIVVIWAPHERHPRDLGAVGGPAGAIAIAGAGVTVVAAAIRRRLWWLRQPSHSFVVAAPTITNGRGGAEAHVTAGAVVTAETVAGPRRSNGLWSTCQRPHSCVVSVPTTTNGEAGQGETLHWTTRRLPRSSAARLSHRLRHTLTLPMSQPRVCHSPRQQQAGSLGTALPQRPGGVSGIGRGREWGRGRGCGRLAAGRRGPGRRAAGRSRAGSASAGRRIARR